VTLATYQPNPPADQKQILTTIHLFSKHIQLANDILIECGRQYFVCSLIIAGIIQKSYQQLVRLLKLSAWQ
jgi:hypothetical protein